MSMSWEEYWNKLNEKKKVSKNVQMSAKQFEKMQKQSYDIGFSHGKKYKPKPDFTNPFNEIFNGFN